MIWLLSALAQAPELLERPILEEVQRYDEQILALDGQLSALEVEAAQRDDVRTKWLSESAHARATLERERAGVRTLVRAFHRLVRRGVSRLLFDAESPAELRLRLRYLQALLRQHQERVAGYRDQLERKGRADRQAEEAGSALAGLRAELGSRREQLATERKRRIDLLAAVRASRTLTARVGQEVGAAQAAFDQSVHMREGTLPASVAAAPSAEFRSARGALTWPVRGAILVPFGASADPATGELRQNQGVDIAASAGTPFHAVFAGQVTRAGYVKSYGQVVMIQHGSYATLYAHANGLRVAEGQLVSAGDLLGFVGATGIVSGGERPRLHFEVRYNGSPQDPTAWLTP